MRRLLLLTLAFACAFSTPVPKTRAAGDAESSGAVAEWIGKLDSAEAAERVAAIEALEKASAAEAVPALLARLDDEAPEVRAAAATALGSIGAEPEKVVAALIAHFEDEEGIIRQQPKLEYVPLWALYGFAAGKFGADAVDPLIEALQSDSPQVYSAAAIGLGEIGAPASKATPRLVEMLESPEEFRRHAAASAIRGIGPEAAAAVPALRRALRHENFHTQYWACRALGGIGPAAVEATPDLVALMKEGVISARRNAAAALGGIGPAIGEEAVNQLVEEMRKDQLEPLREQAVIALGKLRPFAKTTVPAIRRSLEDESFDSRTEAARSLWLLTGKAEEALPVLIASLDDLTYLQGAIDVLAEMGPEAAPAVDKLTEVLKAPDPDDRVAAAWCLGQIGPPARKAIEPLQEQLDDEEPAVREAAKAAIARLSKR